MLFSLNGCYQTMLNNQTPESVQKQETTQDAQEASVLPMPEIPKAKLFEHVMPEKRTLSNGMEVLYVYNPMIPLMSMKVVFRSGGASDPKEKAGLSSMTASMLKEGANGKSAQAISEAIELLGATLGPGMTQDTGSLYLESLTQYFGQAVDILADVWLKPDFSQASFERLKKIALTRLNQRSDSPVAVAKLVSDRAYYGDAHPYGRSVDGYVDTVSALELSDIKARYAELFSASRAAIIGVGNMPIDAFAALMEKKFGQLERSEVSSTEVRAEIPRAEKRLIIVDKPNAPQTVIRIYEPGVPSTSLETLSWQFVNIPFGDSFTSRLMQNIREDKGYSYGANSGISAMQMGGVFVSTSSVESGVTGAALKEFLYELGRLPTGDFTQEEFLRARETWKSELVQSFETQAGVLATISGLYVNQKPMDCINAFARDIEQYRLEDFNRVAREFPTLESATIVLVGDKASILPQLADMDLPEPIYFDTQGNRIIETH